MDSNPKRRQQVPLRWFKELVLRYLGSILSRQNDLPSKTTHSTEKDVIPHSDAIGLHDSLLGKRHGVVQDGKKPCQHFPTLLLWEPKCTEFKHKILEDKSIVFADIFSYWDYFSQIRFVKVKPSSYLNDHPF